MTDITQFTEVRFMLNVTAARENGYDFCCAVCGVGLADDSDEHEGWCPESDDPLSPGHPFLGVRAAISETLP